MDGSAQPKKNIWLIVSIIAIVLLVAETIALIIILPKYIELSRVDEVTLDEDESEEATFSQAYGYDNVGNLTSFNLSCRAGNGEVIDFSLNNIATGTHLVGENGYSIKDSEIVMINLPFGVFRFFIYDSDEGLIQEGDVVYSCIEKS